MRRVEKRRRFDRRGGPADVGPERAGDGQERVAHRLEIEPLAIEPPQQAVFGVAREPGGPRLAPLLIGAREHDPPVQCLDRPAGGDEFAGQIVEQLGMGRRVAAQAEVAGRADQSLAEMPQPDAVDEHAAVRGFLGRRSPGPARAGRSLSETAVRSRLESTLRNRRGTAGPGRPGLPRMKTCGSTGLGASLITIARGGDAGMRRVELLNGAVQLLELPAALDRG